MKTEEPKKILLSEYKPFNFVVENLELFFDIHEEATFVRSKINFRKLISGTATELKLDGVELKLLKISLNGQALTPSQYSSEGESLLLSETPDEFILETEVEIHPGKNTALEGMYQAGKSLMTQCEAQGFRRITYFPDRPDVMTSFTVKIEADQKLFPLLLSNGDLIEKNELANNRHRVTWQDPFKKPCYLFALVAGDLGVIRDSFVTKSKKTIQLEIYAPHGQQDRCLYAMEALKQSMKWDEERFGREYDLGIYMIVATDDFNAGAMENKGLNIFNSRLVLADAKSATDTDYFNIQSVVAHEYFHNWTGNRVTLRDWFHLSLKEGLTVFRDQEFSMDMTSRSAVRIDTVIDLRDGQFAEDDGPTAHPIRPESCYAVDNFFTATIYEKGAEVIRMMQTIVGRPGFRKGMDLYFERHDGKAVVIEDFANAISEANDLNWEQFRLWYSQAGTPRVEIEEKFNDATGVYSLNLKQSCPPTPNQPSKQAFHIPLIFALLDQSGNELQIQNKDVARNSEGQNLIHLAQTEKTIHFNGLKTKPILSINRGFSAPIHIKWDMPEIELLFLLANDQDDFNRWESGQKLATSELRKLIHASPKNVDNSVSRNYISALASALSSQLDPAMKALLLEFPQDAYLLQLEEEFHAENFRNARMVFEKQISRGLMSKLVELYKTYHGQNTESRHPSEFSKRRLKNNCLSLMAETKEGENLALDQFHSAKIMTDQESAFRILLETKSSSRELAIQEFYEIWKHDSLVLNKWFSLQSGCQHHDTFKTVVALCDHPEFSLKNPNRVYAVLRRFGDNLCQFNRSDLDCYEFFADKIKEIDLINPQVATRVAGAFSIINKLPAQQKVRATAALERLMRGNLSKNTFEIVSKSLGRG